MSNKYLFNEEPKSFSPTIAKALGSISKAVIMQQVHFWLHVYTKKADQRHFFDGYYWVFNSYTEWHKDLEFIPFATMKRQILELERDTLLVSSEFNKNRGDRTKWYRINYERLTVLTTGIELNRLVHFEPPSDHFEPPSDHFEPPSDHFEPPSDHFEPPSDHFDPLYIQSDHQSDHQSDQQKKRVETFFSLTSKTQNQAMQQELKTADSANKQDPTPVAPAQKKYADPMGDRFKSGKKHYWQKTISDRPEWQEVLTDWAGTQDCKFGFKGSLLIAQMEHLKKRQLPCEIGDAMGSLANYIKNNDLVSFELRVDAAIAYEKALASNPTIKQSQDTEAPNQDSTMPQVGEIDTNGMVLMADCRWEHFYPRLGRFNKTTGEAEIVWGMINTHPPDPVDERCQKFLEKAKNNPERLAKLLTAKHLADSDFASYDIQAENFLKAKDSLIATLNQEIQKLLSSQAA